jgi:predicted transcriptional regulator
MEKVNKISNIKTDFAFAPLAAVMNLGAGESKVWMALFTIQGVNTYCFPSLDYIRKRLGFCMSKARISQITNQLVKKGWLEKIRKGRRNNYIVKLPSDLLFQPDFSSGLQTNQSSKVLDQQTKEASKVNYSEEHTAAGKEINMNPKDYQTFLEYYKINHWREFDHADTKSA